MTPPRLRRDQPAIALAPDHALVGQLEFTDLPPGGVAALALLDGRHSPRLVSARTGVSPTWLREMLEVLSDADALEPAPRPARVAVEGEGELAATLRSVLALADQATVAAGRGNWHGVDAVVLAPDAAGADRTATDQLLRDDVPHLLVLPAPRGAVVGPFVLPGRTSCVSCLDHVATERDHTWPRRCVLAARTPARCLPPARAWAAGLAAAHVAAWLEGLAPPSADTTWHLEGASLTTRTWRPHPACGCSQPGLLTAAA